MRTISLFDLKAAEAKDAHVMRPWANGRNLNETTGYLDAVTGGDESYQFKIMTAAQHSVALVAAFVREDAFPKPDQLADRESGAETFVRSH